MQEGVSMKNIFISVIVFVVILFSAYFSIRYLNSICTKLTKMDDQLENYVNNEDWDKSYKVSLEFFENWEHYRDKISVFVHHGEIDNISMELWKLTQYVKCRNKDESLASIHSLKFLMKHISDMEKVNFQNIF